MQTRDNLISFSPVDFTPPPLPIRSSGSGNVGGVGSAADTAGTTDTASNRRNSITPPPPPLPLRKGSGSSTSSIHATASALSRPQPATPAPASKVKSSIPIMPPPARINSPGSSLRGGPSNTSLNRITERSRSGSVNSTSSTPQSIRNSPAPSSIFKLTQPTPIDKIRYQSLYNRLTERQSKASDRGALDVRIVRRVWKASKLDNVYLDTLYNNCNTPNKEMDANTFTKSLATIDSELRRRKS
ncbi:hypothetical protein E3P91_00727 [Wallemia ichthyophaga]|nr:hypothetical protein E3P91_00727 [Wallemia ichthyophaga]